MIRFILFLYISLNIASTKESEEELYKKKKILKEFDLNNVSLFLENKLETTSSFSPVAFYQLEAIMSGNNEFNKAESEVVKSCEKSIDEVKNQIHELKLEEYCGSKNSNENSAKLENSKNSLELFEANYTENGVFNYAIEIKNIIKKENSTEKEKHNKLHRSYLSCVYFTGQWNKGLYMNEAAEGKFIGKQGTENKTYMSIKGLMIFESFKNDSGTFNMVVLPFKEDGKNKNKHAMVYLIPEDNSYELKRLWEDFIMHSQGEIVSFVNRFEEKYVDFQAPKIERLVSSQLNITDIFRMKYSLNNNISEINMTTHISLNSGNSGSESTSESNEAATYSKIRVNVSYISFIYDFNIERILMFINYTGSDSIDKNKI